ncbi:type II toxin-antitoxin system prevent-host-death family antitoxin [Candidatus Kaiserbacteria bacterium CG10_big_fil_rev_8_21_14_0_10_51_14]|uniref:Antitoxin n=1 Tax=Candidatus Kaiserbacteria bacterium CG10_big_fil_rev_8_21_14_0_10_51_14 TaxID=1974610 RepID=A0A2H0UD16_9BACT|nr:MAG: type II toxin-antitoxin system prevent-host-death family antitoxin [Candidatus Kaiserbacteria bacterium CG10_big_fil_rev_8_21_14_0_10_51_14]
MKTVGSYELKTHLAKFLARVIKGETITITKHGREIARIIPARREGKLTKEEAIQRLKTMKRVPLRGITIRDLIEEGRNRHIPSST